MTVASQGSKWIRPAKRLAIYARDGHACLFCGCGAEETPYLTLDHVLACELGGSNKASNLVTCCLSCNSSKRDLTIRQWFVVLRDRGIDTTGMSDKIRRHTSRKLDMPAAKAILAARA